MNEWTLPLQPIWCTHARHTLLAPCFVLRSHWKIGEFVVNFFWTAFSCLREDMITCKEKKTGRKDIRNTKRQRGLRWNQTLERMPETFACLFVTVGNGHTPLSVFKLTSSHAGPDERSEVRVSGWRRRPWSDHRWGSHTADSGGSADGNTTRWTSDEPEPDQPMPERARDTSVTCLFCDQT